MDEILKPSVADPRGERILDELRANDLSALSVADLEHRLTALQSEIDRTQAAIKKRQGASAAAEALFKK